MTGSPAAIRVLILIDALGIGGAERSVISLVPALQEHGVVPVVCTVTDRRAELVPVLRERFRGPYHCLSSSGLRDTGAFLRLLRLIRQVRPHLLHAHLSDAVAMGAAASLLTGIPLVITRHGMAPVSRTSSFERRARVELFVGRRVARRVIAVSEATRSYLLDQGCRDERIRVVYNGADPSTLGTVDGPARRALAAELGIRSDDRIVATVGMMEPEKGHRLVIEALALVKASVPSARVVFAGSGPCEPELRAATDRLGLGTAVSFAGDRTAVSDLLGLSAVFCLPSSTEAFSVAVLEAMAAGLPVVTTAVGGMVEMVENGQTGLLVRPDSVAEVAAALTRVLLDPLLATSMGRAARERVERFYSLALQVRRTAGVYAEVAGRGARTP